MPSDRPRSRKGPFLLIVSLLFLSSLFLLAFLPNPFLDRAASSLCTGWLGRPVELRGVHIRFTGSREVLFDVGEIDLRKALQEEDTAAGRFVRRHDVAPWFVVRNSRWMYKSGGGTSYLRLLEAYTEEAFIQGGLRSESGQISRWNAALRLPRSLWVRFPALAGKRFGQDPGGRRLLKLTCSGGHLRLWGRSGPVLEASWQ